MRDFSGDHRWLSINTVTLREVGGLDRIVDLCARHGVGAIAPWRPEIAAYGLERAARLFRDAGLTLSGYVRAGFFGADPAHRAAMRDDNRRAVEEAAALGGCPLVVVPGGLPQFARPGSAPSKDLGAARAMAEEELGRLLDHARAAGVPLALEPLHPMHAAERGCVSTLGEALDICDRLDPDRTGALGVVLDVYHVWWDPALAAGIARAGAARLLAFHICDWLTPTRHMLNDRGMMGDGVIEIRRIRSLMEAAGYRGHAEVEIFSDDWWAVTGDTLVATILDRFRRFV